MGIFGRALNNLPYPPSGGISKSTTEGALADKEGWLEEVSNEGRGMKPLGSVSGWLDEDERLWLWLRGYYSRSRRRRMLPMPVDYGFLITLPSASAPRPRSRVRHQRIRLIQKTPGSPSSDRSSVSDVDSL